MKTYQGSEIRNVAVMGHAHSGKTTFIAALLHAAKMTSTQGRVADGTAVTAYDDEEIARGATMQNAVAFVEWQGVKINLVDTPGFHMFSHEARAALLPVEAAVVVVNAQNGVESVTERVWRYAEEAAIPRVVVVNQMDHPKAGGGGGLSALMDDLVDRWGRNCVPVQLPISDSKGFHGVVDLVTMEAFYYEPGGDGRGKVTGEIPNNLAADAKARHEALVELVAEGKDELMEEYFEKGTIPEDHLIAALHEAIREDRIFPVLFSSGQANMALDHLLDFIKVYCPSPVERAPFSVHAPAAVAAGANGSGSTDDVALSLRKVADTEPAAMVVFKTMTDPFSGRISFFKVISGVIKNDVTVENYTRRSQERLTHLSIMQGCNEVLFGDGSLLEVLLHQLVLALGHQFDQSLVAGLGVGGEAGRNFRSNLAAAIAAGSVVVGAHGDQIDHAVETFGAGDGQLDGNTVAAPAVDQVVHEGAQTASAAGLGVVHLGDDDDAGDAGLFGEPPHPLGDGLDAILGVDHDQRGLDGKQGGTGFVGKHVEAGSIDEVDLGALPLGKGDGVLHSDAAGDFLFVIGGGGRAVLHAALGWGHFRGMQQSGDQRGFATVRMPHYSYVADLTSLIRFHGVLLGFCGLLLDFRWY